MLWKHGARGDDREFTTVKNVEASSITNGMGVCLRITTAASFDGVNAVMSRSGQVADLRGFLGISVQDIPTNGYGLVQTYGACVSVLLSEMNTSITINNGDPLSPTAQAGALSSLVGTPTFNSGGFGYVIASNVPTNTLSTAAPLYISGFIRCRH